MASIKQFNDPLTRKKSQPVPTVQRKLKVGSPNSKSEKEADNVADRVMRMPENEDQETVNMQPQQEEEKVSKISRQAEAGGEDSSTIKMQPEEEEKDTVSMKPEEEEASLQKQEDEELQKKAEDEDKLNMQNEEEETSISKASEDKEEVNLKSTTASAEVKYAPSRVVNQINASQSGGQALPKKANAELSQKMGRDFSNVKIHKDARAVQMNKDLSAKAFTHKNHIYFNQGQYAPESKEGKRLLAHELTHTVQQQKGNAPEVQTKKRVTWRLYYAKKKGGYNVYFNRAKEFGLNPSSKGKPGKLTFEYDTYSEAEMIQKRESAMKTLGKHWKVSVTWDNKLKSYRLRINPIYPKGHTKASANEYFVCFNQEAEANKQLKQYQKYGIKASLKKTPTSVSIFGYLHKVGGQVFIIRYRKISAATAKTIGESEIKKREGHQTGMYKVKVIFDKQLNTHRYTVSTTAPVGYKSLGKHLITGYVTAHEKEFAVNPKVTNPPGLKGTFRKKFLYETQKHPRGVKFQGSGKSISGKIIQYKTSSKSFYESPCPTTATGTCAKVGRTAAVDFSLINKGAKILIEDIGIRYAEDTGGAIKGKHIDVYYGYIGMNAARKKSMKNKKVFLKK